VPGRLRAAPGGLPLGGRVLLDVVLHEPGDPAALPPGVGYSGSLIPAPSEHVRLDDARRAVKAFAALMLLWGQEVARSVSAKA
jgi:hypothetical protein